MDESSITSHHDLIDTSVHAIVRKKLRFFTPTSGVLSLWKGEAYKLTLKGHKGSKVEAPISFTSGVAPLSFASLSRHIVTIFDFLLNSGFRCELYSVPTPSSTSTSLRILLSSVRIFRFVPGHSLTIVRELKKVT